MISVRMCVALAGVLFSLLSNQEPKKPVPFRATTDGAIMDTVMVDLITAKDSPWEGYRGAKRPEKSKRKIQFSVDTQNDAVTEDRVLERYERDQWSKLSKEEFDAVQEAANDLVSRRSERDWLNYYQPTDKRITLVNEKERREGDRSESIVDRPQVFRAFAPGYSRAGKIACVHLSYPWSGGFHGGVATYVLANRKGKWIVLIRQFIRYV